MRISDWSSDVCSSDLIAVDEEQAEQHQEVAEVERIAGGAEEPVGDQRVGVDPLIHAAALDVDEPDDRRAQHLARQGKSEAGPVPPAALDFAAAGPMRSEKRRVGTAGVSTGRSRGTTV